MQNQEAASTATVNVAVVNMRTGADVSASAIHRLPRGTKVQVLGREGNWLRVKADDVEGFVHAQYVTLPQDYATTNRPQYEELKGINNWSRQ